MRTLVVVRLLPVALACVIVLAVMLVVAPAAGVAQGSAPPSTVQPDDEPVDGPIDVDGADRDDGPPDTLPLVPVPAGCTAPRSPHIVFVGEVVDRDYRTVRFEIDQIRSGRPDPFAADGLIDIRYGIDAQYLDDDRSYLVSAVVEPDLGLLVSRVTDPVEHFGGDEVIGVSETDVDCPNYEDPMRTLDLDGTPVAAGVLEPFFDARWRIVSAITVPFLVALGAIFVLATIRLSVSGIYRGIVDAGRRRIG